MHELNRSLHVSCAIFLQDRYNFAVRNALLGERFALYEFADNILVAGSLLAIGSQKLLFTSALLTTSLVRE